MKLQPTADELDYQSFLVEVKARFAGARIAAARTMSRELIGLYWNLGALIVGRQIPGLGTVDRGATGGGLANDLPGRESDA